MAYILIDTSNLFFRAKHVVRGSDIETKIGMAMHIIFASVNKVYRDLHGTHAVFCLEGHSWRKDTYAPYKRNRKVARDARTATEAEEDDLFFAAFNEFQTFLKEETNVTVLQSSVCEADDFIARWIQTHPNDEHIIISSDSDFYQLLSPTVSQYNGITNQHITITGIVNDRGRPVKDKKTGEQKQIGDPAWLLFEKCMRGDVSDNIFSAYPGVRKKGTRNKVGLLEAFADRHDKGFNWNNLMLQRWIDSQGVEHIVRDDYLRNVELVDLTAQPDNIKDILDTSIIDAVKKEPVKQVGVRLLRFCGKHNLVKVGENSNDHVRYLGSAY